MTGDVVVLDPAVLDTLRQLTMPGEPDVLGEVLTVFLQETPPRMERLRNAWAAGDIQQMQRAAHSLKGSTGNIGARAMFEVCKTLNETGDAEAARPWIEALAAEFSKVEAEIQRLIKA